MAPLNSAHKINLIYSSPEAVLAYIQEKYDLTSCHLGYIAAEVQEVFDDVESNCGVFTAEDLDDIKWSIDEIERVYLQNLQYMLDERVGQGTYGTVYRAHHIQSNQVVAVKVIDIELSNDDVFTITNEILTVARLRGCPQLVSYITSYALDSSLWVVTEFLDGGSALDRVKTRGPMSEEEIAVICREVLLGLFSLNREGIIHRDIKAGNILLSKSGKVKLADFGASGQITDTKSKCETFLGTPYWIAPEVIAQNLYDGRADVWSLGITCHEMLTGKPPRHNLTVFKLLQVIPSEPAPHLPDNGQYSKDFVDFVNSCLTKDPNERPSVKQLLRHPLISKAGPMTVLSIDE